jgi:HAE1 family hydrophobic/amphiphilic exporter-1
MIGKLVAACIHRRVTVLMVSLAIVAFGIVGFSRLTLDLLPDITYPSITVQTEFPDTAPGEVENLVTKPVEEVVGVLRGLQEVHSVSRAGISEVTLEFGWDSDMDDLAMEVREKLDRLVLPEEAENPIVLRYDPALDPIVRLALTGSSDLTLLRRVAEKQVKEILETIPGVAAAQLRGGEEEEIQIDLDQGKLTALGISPGDVGRVLAASNVNRPGGSLKSTESQYLVRTLNEYDSLQEIADLTINPSGPAPVRLSDVATVTWGAKEREEITRAGEQESVEIAVFKEGDANTVTVVKEIEETLDLVRDALPAGMKVDVLFDQSRFIKQSISEVWSSLLVGGGLAILVLYLFLRNVRPTLVIATSIPLSVLATFILMYRFSVSLNVMSLGGLTLGIGMLVDASIVVLEAIHRKRVQGLPPWRAAIQGTSEVGGAVAASVLTTVAVFLPIVFVEGIAGQLFRDQAITVTISQMASLLVALTVVPTLAAFERRKKGAEAPRPSEADLLESENEDMSQPVPWTLGAFSRHYDRFVRGALDKPMATLAIATFLFVLSIVGAARVGMELIPPLSEGEFHFEVVLPEGTPLPVTDRVIREMDQAARANGGVALTFSTAGSRQVSGGLSLETKDENLGQLNVVMKDRADDEGEHSLAEDLRDRFRRIPNLVAKLGRPSFFSLKTPVELIFYGEDLDQLRDYTLGLLPRIADVQGVADLRASMEAGNPELTVEFDRDHLASMGLTIDEAAGTLQNRVQGVVVSRFKEQDRQIDIRVRNQARDRATVGDIENLVVSSPGGVPVTLASIASVQPARGPAEIHRIQQSRAAIISGEVAGRSLGGAIDDIERVIKQSPPPRGIAYSMAGQNREMEVSFGSLRFALILAIFLVYIVMAATFENLLHPFLILFTIPLAMIGVVPGLLLTGHTWNVISLIGVILLAGIVVNNAIVLVDGINRYRRLGVEKHEAILRAGHVRLRPILMTTLTTVLGLLPMTLGIGEGAELRAPLAVVVTFGMVVSTLLTLVVIPALYWVVPSTVRAPEEDDE